MTVLGFGLGYGNPALAQQAFDLASAVEADQIALTAAFDAGNEARYALFINANPGPVVVVPTGSTPTLISLPVATAAWRPDFWVRSGSGVYTADGAVNGRYVAFCVISFSDDALAGTSYTWSFCRGRDLATTPVIAQRFNASAQIAVLGEPVSCAPGGEFALPDGTSNDREIGLYVVHSSGSPRTVTVDSIAVVVVRQRDLDQT